MTRYDENSRRYRDVGFHGVPNAAAKDNSDDEGGFNLQESKDKFPEDGHSIPNSKDYLCGVGDWRPAWLQKFANHRVFAVSYVIIGVVQGMIYSYFNGVLTTVEKTFAIPSKTLGIILSGNDISQILCGVLLTYIGGRGSRPRWLSIGMILTSLSCYLYASAQLFWDGENLHKIVSKANIVDQSLDSTHIMCQRDETPLYLNSSAIKADEQCGDQSSNSISALVVFFIGQFISGIGSTALFTLGFTYMDDNVKKSVSPLYISISGALRSLGPTIGYMLASACLKVYIQPTETPEYNQRDPRWLGAWWMGFLIIGTLQIFITFPILLFPKELPSKQTVDSQKQQEAKTEKKVSIWIEFFKSMKRLFKNPLVVFHLLAVGPIILGMVGFSMFLPKYLEAQFGQTAAQASVLTGVSGLFMMMIGTLLGGIVIWKFQPSATKIVIWSVCVDIIYALGIFTIMQFECESVTFNGVDVYHGSINVTSTCGRSCACETVFDPLCVDNQNYLSPCLAGCASMNGTNTDKTKNFMECSCAFSFNSSAFIDDIYPNGVSGYCPGSRGNCYYFWPYLLILGTIKMLGSTNRVGGMIILLRGVNKEDKSLLMALLTAVTSLLGFIPGPIVYGAIVDSTCLLWDEKGCGKKGNCWLYNLDELRYWFHGLTMCCFAIAIILDMLIVRVVKNINLYEEDPSSRVLTYSEGFLCKKQEEEEKPTTNKS